MKVAPPCHHIIIYLLMVLFLTGKVSLSGQVSAIGSRGAAITGTANIGSVQRGLMALHGNQAGLATLQSWGAYASVENRWWGTGDGIRSASLAVAYPSRSGVWALALRRYGVPDYRELMIGLSYSRKLMEGLDIGVQFDQLQIRIPRYGKHMAYTLEGGILLALAPLLNLGFHFYNPLQVEWSEGETLPAQVGVGVGYEISREVYWMAEVEKTSGWKANIKSALTYYPVINLAIRLGINTFPSLISIGVGYSLNPRARVDMAGIAHQQLGITTQAGIAFSSGEN